MAGNLEQQTRAITIAVFNGVIYLTRVDTGRARGNWQTSVGIPKRARLTRLDPSGAAAVEEVLREVAPFSLNILTNNLPYIVKLEELDGMAGRTVARIERIIREAA